MELSKLAETHAFKMTQLGSKILAIMKVVMRVNMLLRPLLSL